MLERTREQFQQEGTPQREFDAFLYQAGTWSHPRRVVVKVEVNSRGINRRFVVSNRTDPSPRSLYEDYIDRGQTEDYIKPVKLHLKRTASVAIAFWPISSTCCCTVWHTRCS